MSIHVGKIDDKSVEEFLNDLDIRNDESNMYTDIEKELDELVAKGIFSEWRWKAEKLLVFIDDTKWEEFNKVIEDLFVLDDTGLKAIIQRDYICLVLNPDEDFNL